MSRTALNYVIDLVTMLLFAAMVATGLILAYVLPPGSGGGGNRGALLLWGCGRHDWGDVHFWIAVGLIAVLTLHVALHWTWVCAVTRHRILGRTRRPKSRLANDLAGVGLVATVFLVIAAFLWFASASVVKTESERGRHRGGQLGAAFEMEARVPPGT